MGEVGRGEEFQTYEQVFFFFYEQVLGTDYEFVLRCIESRSL
jgi:hypothetical protein